MKRLGWVVVGLASFFLQGLTAQEQDKLDLIDQDLKLIQMERQEVIDDILGNFNKQLDAALGSPDAAIALYRKAGGNMPDPSPVQSKYENETPDEKAAREAKDAANLSLLAKMVQLHCGLMHFAASYAVAPDQKGLHDAWVSWLKTASPTYVQILGSGVPQAQEGRSGRRDPLINALRIAPVRDSVINTYLGFHGWDNKKQAAWAVRDLPNLYRTEVLEPLRVAPTAETISAWDAYLAMKNVDPIDPTKWTQVEYPALAFDRACDDYAATPGTEKLAALVVIIKANLTQPKVDDWIARAQELSRDYRARLSGGAAPPPTPPPPANPLPPTP